MTQKLTLSFIPYADISKLESLTGFKNEVGLDEGLKITFEWYLEHPRTG